MCVCLVAMNSIILLWVISVYLMSCNINYIRYLTRTFRLFVDEHSLSFFWSQKKMSSVGVLMKKNLSVLWEKKSNCPKKNFQSVERGKNVSVEFRVFGKKELKERFREEKTKCFWWNFLLSSCSLVNLQVEVTEKKWWKKKKKNQSIFRLGVWI